MASTRSSRRATERATFRRGPARVPGLSRWRAAWLVMAASLAAPVAAQERPQEDRVEVFRNLPYWPGYWVAEDQTDVPISGIPVRDETTPPPRNDALGMWAAQIPWNDEGRRRVEEVSRTMGGRKSLGWGYPLMMASATPLLFLITPEHVLIINAYNEARHIYTDGRGHPPPEDLWPTVTGHSIGHWEGETLVIDTIMVRNPNEFFQGAPPLSEEAHYIERIWLDGDKLRAEMTVEDPVTLAAPWKSRLAWVRDPGFDRMLQVDWNNDRTGTDGEFNTIEPTED
jgi:hypothetical protein